VKQAPLLYLFL